MTTPYLGVIHLEHSSSKIKGSTQAGFSMILVRSVV